MNAIPFFRFLAFAGLLALPLGAQVGPGPFLKPHPSFVIVSSFNSVPGQDIQDVFHAKLPGDGAGVYTTALTVGGLPKFFGGNGKSRGLIMGAFQPYLGRFQVNLEAKALNSTKDDRHLSLDPSGLFAIFDRDDGVWLSSRTKVGVPFPAPRLVTGFGKLRDVYPHLGKIGNKTYCFYSDSKQILRQEIDLKKGALLGTPISVSLPLQKGARPTFPFLLQGGDGDVEGLFFSEEVKPRPNGDSDLVFASDLDPATPPVMVVQRPDYTNSPSFAGGILSFAHDILPRYHIMEGEFSWMIGDVEGLGGTADLAGAASARSFPKSLFTALFLGAKTMPKLPIAGIKGALGVHPGVLFFMGLVAHQGGQDGSWKASFPIPRDPSLKGLKTVWQGLTIDSGRKVQVFTNTAWVKIQ
ncbi:MAG TPA: hypothetical protein ENK02_15495 [Planctomycetes bacterium]|nr:hypothetical protein [Planctomycetota bacterium]